MNEAGAPTHHQIAAALPATTTFNPAPVVPLAAQAPARLVVDSALPEQLARGYVVVRYRAENVRIMPVFPLAILLQFNRPTEISADDLRPA